MLHLTLQNIDNQDLTNELTFIQKNNNKLRFDMTQNFMCPMLRLENHRFFTRPIQLSIIKSIDDSKHITFF